MRNEAWGVVPAEDMATFHCACCSKPYRNPKVLPCLHSFCESCLENHQRDVCGDGELTCPVTFCQKSAGHISPGDLLTNSWLKTKVSVDAMVEEILSGNCEICDESKTLESFCNDCSMAMCGDCITSWHGRNKRYKTHTLVPITGKSTDTLKSVVAGESREDENCRHHAGKLCEFFCTDCNKLSCSVCQLTGACKKHKFSYLPDFVKAFKDGLQNSVQTLQSPIKKLQKALDECEELTDKISVCEKKVEEEINAAINMMMESLMKQKQELLDECRRIAQSKRTRLSIQIEQLKKAKQQMEHCSEVVSTACGSHTAADLVPVKDLMMTHIESLNEEFEKQKLHPCTSCGITTIFQSQVQVGEVANGCYPPLCVLEVPVNEPVTCEMHKEKKLRVVTMNEEGERHERGGETVVASLNSSNTSIPVNEVLDNHDGTYHILFTPHCPPGEYQLVVKINDCHIVGSPFSASVTDYVDYQLEKNQIGPMLSQRLKVGDAWFLVDRRWFTQWRRYVGYDAWDLRFAGKLDAHPGLIDNSALLKCSTQEVLKDHLLEELDYTLLPKQAWDLLVSRYGLSQGSSPIPRYVVEYGTHVKHLKVEVYLIGFKLCVHPNVRDTKTYFFSRGVNIGKPEDERRFYICGSGFIRLTILEGTVTAKIRTEFNVPDSAECRLWQRYTTNTYELLTKTNETLSEAGLYGGQLLMLEVKGDDNKWPRDEVK